MKQHDNSIIIIGAGFAGLAAGIYGRMNGYNTRIFEMHNQPGGLCASWKRKDYTFDGCIHWLVGSNPQSSLNHIWNETGVAQGREFVYPEEYARFEGADGRTVVFHANVDTLEKHLIELSPRDEKTIREFADGIRMCLSFDFPSPTDAFGVKMKKQVSTALSFIKNKRQFDMWGKMTGKAFAKKFSDPLLRDAFLEIWIPEFSMLFMLFTFAYLHQKNAGYPIGGSKPMSEALGNRYRELGGELFYNSRVSRILTSDGRATGIRLDDGTEHMAGKIISAADGYSTLFSMLDEKYVDAQTRAPYEKWPVFHPILFVSMGVNRKFDDVSVTVSGFSFALKEPVMIAEKLRSRLPVHIYNQDPTLAPEGKTMLNVMLDTDYEYWKKLGDDPAAYKRKKAEIGETVVSLLEQRFPGITPLVEVIDVATPLTLERYTGNWKGSFEGWLITPDNAGVLMKPMRQTLPSLKNFYMCGQWVEPGGGLPTSIMSGRRLVKAICREDGIPFRTA